MPNRPQVTDTTAYINQVAEAAQPILNNLVQLITTELPDFKARIKWNLPFYERDKHYVSIARQPEHLR